MKIQIQKKKNNTDLNNKQANDTCITPNGIDNIVKNNYNIDYIYNNLNSIFDKINSRMAYKLDNLLYPVFPQADEELKDLKKL